MTKLWAAHLEFVEFFFFFQRDLLFYAYWVTLKKQCKIIIRKVLARPMKWGQKMQRHFCRNLWKCTFTHCALLYDRGKPALQDFLLLLRWIEIDGCLRVIDLALQDWIQIILTLNWDRWLSMCDWPGHLIDTGREAHAKCFVVRLAVVVVLLCNTFFHLYGNPGGWLENWKRYNLFQFLKLYAIVDIVSKYLKIISDWK